MTNCGTRIIVYPKMSCQVCTVPTTKRCSGCKTIHYCSVECQKHDRRAHKRCCIQLHEYNMMKISQLDQNGDSQVSDNVFEQFYNNSTPLVQIWDEFIWPGNLDPYKHDEIN